MGDRREYRGGRGLNDPISDEEISGDEYDKPEEGNEEPPNIAIDGPKVVQSSLIPTGIANIQHDCSARRFISSLGEQRNVCVKRVIITVLQPNKGRRTKALV